METEEGSPSIDTIHEERYPSIPTVANMADKLPSCKPVL